jgi:hypothetical protein
MKQNNTFYHIINFIVRAILAVVVFLLFLHSIFSTSFMGWITKEDGSLQAHTLNIADSPWKHLLALCLVTVLLVVGQRLAAKTGRGSEAGGGMTGRASQPAGGSADQEHIAQEKKIAAATCVVAALGILIAGAWILTTRFLPGSDPAKVCSVASQWMAGDFSAFEEGNYLFCYPFQSGIVLFYYLLSKLFGDGNYVAMQFVNLIALAAIYYLFYRICSRFWKKEKSVLFFVYLALVLWMPLLFYVTYLYGILPGMACSLGAVFFAVGYLENRKWWYMFPAALLMGLATVLKMNCLIYLIAIACFLVYDAIDLLLVKRQKGRQWLISLAFIAVMGLGVSVCNQATNAYVEHLSGYEMPEGEVMLSWVVMGLSEAPNAPGNYNGYIGDVFTYYHYDTELATMQSKADLKIIVADMLEHPVGSGLIFFARKTAYQWNDPTFIAIERMEGRQSTIAVPAWVQSLIYGSGKVKFSVVFNIVQTLILIGMLFYLIFTRKSENINELLIAVVFLGGYLFHMVWESSGSYTLPYFVMLIPYAVKGFAEYGKWAERAWLWLTESTFARKRKDVKNWLSKRKAPVTAVAVVIVLLLLFTRTSLFTRTIAPDDGEDAYRQFYQLEDD